MNRTDILRVSKVREDILSVY